MLIDERLRRLFVWYIISGLVFCFVLSGVIVVKKYEDSVAAEFKTLQQARANLAGLKDAGIELERALSDIKKAMPADYRTKTPEEFLLMGLDELKAKIRDAEIVVDNLDNKGDDISLHVRMQAPMKDYAVFTRNSGYLQSLQFPFFVITALSINQSQEKTAVTYEINGSFKIPKKMVL